MLQSKRLEEVVTVALSSAPGGLQFSTLHAAVLATGLTFNRHELKEILTLRPDLFHKQASTGSWRNRADKRMPAVSKVPRVDNRPSTLGVSLRTTNHPGEVRMSNLAPTPVAFTVTKYVFITKSATTSCYHLYDDCSALRTGWARSIDAGGHKSRLLRVILSEAKRRGHPACQRCC